MLICRSGASGIGTATLGGAPSSKRSSPITTPSRTDRPNLNSPKFFFVNSDVKMFLCIPLNGRGARIIVNDLAPLHIFAYGYDPLVEVLVLALM